MGRAGDELRTFARRRRAELSVAALIFFSCAYFFQGGGWNQNAHYATTVALVETGSIHLDAYQKSTGDLSRSGDHVVSAKAVITALTAVPGYLVARGLTLPVDNRGDAVILRAYLTTLLSAGLALTLLGVVLVVMLRRRLGERDAAFVALGICLATPLFPNSTMLTSHPQALLAATCAYWIAEGPRLQRPAVAPSTRTLLLAGVAVGATLAFEYMLAVIAVPLGLYLMWQCRRRLRIAWFCLGASLVALIPIVHHTWAYGHPLRTGYGALTHGRFAADAARGWMGFDGLSIARLYELTFGDIRGFFFLSPFLLAAVPGLIRMLRARRTRPEGLVTGAIAWGVLLLVSALAYWHSGSAVGSRYALCFVAFCAVPIAAIFPYHRIWIGIGAAVGYAFMVMATSVTAIPPTPGRLPYENVIRWLWTRFSVGNLASWQQPILIETGVGTGDPTLPFAFNLGQLAGLNGLISVVPYLVLMAVGGLWMARNLGRRTIA